MKNLDESYNNSLSELTEMVGQDAFAKSLTESDIALISKMEEIQEAEVLYIKPSNTNSILVATPEANKLIFEAAKVATMVAYQETYLGEEDDEDEFDGDSDDEGSADEEEQFPQMESEEDEDEDEDEDEEDEEDEDESMSKEEAVSILNTLDSLFEAGEVTIYTDLKKAGITFKSHTNSFAVLAESATSVSMALCEALGLEFEGVSLTEGVYLGEGSVDAIAHKIASSGKKGSKVIADLYGKDVLALGKKGTYHLSKKGKAIAGGTAAGLAGVALGAKKIANKNKKPKQVTQEGVVDAVATKMAKSKKGAEMVGKLYGKDFLNLSKKGVYGLTGKGKAVVGGTAAAGLAGAAALANKNKKPKQVTQEGVAQGLQKFAFGTMKKGGKIIAKPATISNFKAIKTGATAGVGVGALAGIKHAKDKADAYKKGMKQGVSEGVISKAIKVGIGGSLGYGAGKMATSPLAKKSYQGDIDAANASLSAYKKGKKAVALNKKSTGK